MKSLLASTVGSDVADLREYHNPSLLVRAQNHVSTAPISTKPTAQGTSSCSCREQGPNSLHTLQRREAKGDIHLIHNSIDDNVGVLWLILFDSVTISSQPAQIVTAMA